MEYKHIVEAVFLDRPNRFIAHCQVQGKTETVHVKNTGRCQELLIPGARVLLEHSEKESRSTAYDLIAVYKKDRLINMDSQAPNGAVREWLEKKILFPDLNYLKPECVFGNSRFDFYAETENEKIFIEVKGVTREQDNIVCFPDAPSERAIKHVEELIKAKQEGYRVIVLFVVQMENVLYFTPDEERHPAFCDALRKAAASGVEVMAYDCEVGKEYMHIRDRVPVSLNGRTPTEVITEAVDLSLLISPLTKWFDQTGRKLPWRENVTPYKVWVSEIMLQQTRVEAVKPYFKRFMDTLPEIWDLSQANEETLLKLWEGLGYYNRIRNMQKAARVICDDYYGRMPADYDKLMELPGIGSYTAGAVSSIAFGLPYPAVDGNVLRVLSRIRMDDRDIADAKVKSGIEQELLPVMKLDNPGKINQALMELGACVCVPGGEPNCKDCPVSTFCKAHQAGRETEFPKKSGKKPRIIEKKTVFILLDEEKLALRKRPDKGLLAGLYELPMVEGHLTHKQMVSFLDSCGIHAVHIKKLPEAKHIFSHKEWHMKGYQIKVDELAEKVPGGKLEDMFYAPKEEIQNKYPLPSAFETYFKYLEILQGKNIFSKEER